MPVLQVTIDIKEDGQPLPGFPLTQQATLGASSGRSSYTRSSTSGFVDLALGELETLNVLFAHVDRAVTLQFNDQSDAGIPLLADGLVLLFGANIPSTAAVLAALENVSGSSVRILQVAAGEVS